MHSLIALASVLLAGPEVQPAAPQARFAVIDVQKVRSTSAAGKAAGELDRVVEELAAATAVTLVFDRKESGVLYAAGPLDVTAPVLRRVGGEQATFALDGQFLAVVDMYDIPAGAALDGPLAQLASEMGFGIAVKKFESGLIYASTAIDITGHLLRKLRDPSYRADVPAARPSRVAVVDAQKVLMTTRQGKEARARLMKLKNDLLAKTKAMSGEAQKEFARKADLQIYEAQNAEVKRLDAAVQPVVVALAEENGFAAIIGKDAWGLIYAQPAADVTDQVIQRFDAHTLLTP